MKCRHDAFTLYHWNRPSGAWIEAASATGRHMADFISKWDRANCADCGKWLSLGPANDDDERVQVEIAAADRYASYVDHNYRPGYDRFDYCPTTKSDELCELCESLYLASCIAAHEEPNA